MVSGREYAPLPSRTATFRSALSDAQALLTYIDKNWLKNRQCAKGNLTPPTVAKRDLDTIRKLTGI
ncbi:MAG: hypothetical protein OXE41_07680, partial [Gammaproteobacteria bacterium]|nr:hypothetical protein [Gammaproteobacteria bacterium]